MQLGGGRFAQRLVDDIYSSDGGEVCITLGYRDCSKASARNFSQLGATQHAMRCAVAIIPGTIWSAALFSAGLGLSLSAAEPVREGSSSSSLPPAHGMSDAVVPPKTELTKGDKAFVEKAANKGMEELAISRIAVERATHPEVREYAQMIVTEHAKSNTELMSLVVGKGITLPANDTSVEKWKKRNAKDFDKDYIAAMMSRHKEAVELYDKQAKKGEDADVMNFAGKNVPVLRAHLAKAEGLKKMLK